MEILFRDDYLLAVNKEAGFPVHETVDPLRPHVQGLLEKTIGQKTVLFHRLDLETTGVLLFGLDDCVNGPMTDAFRLRKVQKTYWAVVDGRWLPEWNLIESRIEKAGGGRWKSLPPKASKGDFARTRVRLVKTTGEKSLIEVSPETGRTHQIRLHCLEKAHPVMGDRLYGVAERRGIPMALHAKILEFQHPVTGAPVRIEAPLPAYWADFWLKGL